jgi:hypothetical protein
VNAIPVDCSFILYPIFYHPNVIKQTILIGQRIEIFVMKLSYLIKGQVILLKTMSADNYKNKPKASHLKTFTTAVMILTVMMLIAVVVSKTPPIKPVDAQNSTTNTKLNAISNLSIAGKSYPIKYNMTTGKLLGLIEDKDKSTLIAIISTPSDKETLTIELPRNIIDDKGQSNADAKYTVHVDGKDATFRETSNNPNSRTLAIDFNKDARMIEIIGTQTSQQQ